MQIACTTVPPEYLLGRRVPLFAMHMTSDSAASRAPGCSGGTSAVPGCPVLISQLGTRTGNAAQVPWNEQGAKPPRWLSINDSSSCDDLCRVMDAINGHSSLRCFFSGSHGINYLAASCSTYLAVDAD